MMKIRFRDIEHHLPADIQRRQSRTSISKNATFWIIHPPENPSIWIEETPGAKNNLAHGDAFLFVSGNGVGGFGWTSRGIRDAEALEKEWKDRVHCLRPACSERTRGVHQQISLLLDEVERLPTEGDIPWWIVQPAESHENLVALYLLGVAAEGMDADCRTGFMERWATVDPEWKEVLLERALAEYVAVTKGEMLNMSRVADAIPAPELLPHLRQALHGRIDVA